MKSVHGIDQCENTFYKHAINYDADLAKVDAFLERLKNKVIDSCDDVAANGPNIMSHAVSLDDNDASCL